MALIAGIPIPLRHLRASETNPRRCFIDLTTKVPVSSTLAAADLCLSWSRRSCCIHLKTKASISEEAYTEEAETKVKFPASLTVPGCSSTLFLLGTGFREKVFAIIGVKVYAAGFYANPSIFTLLAAWKGRSAAEIQQDSSIFNTIFNAPSEKSLHIVLVRDVDGKTFWDALDEAVSPRIASRSLVDESALSKFRSVFQERSLKKGTSIFMTWLGTTKMLISISSNSMPSTPEETIESSNVTFALFDVFLGDKPVSHTLKASVSNGLDEALK